MLDEIKDLIKNGNNFLAYRKLHNVHSSNMDILKLKSLVMMKLGVIREEKELIGYSLKMYPNWKYMHERNKWHNLPRHQQLVPRHLKHDSEIDIKEEDIQKLCFSTVSSRSFFDMLVDLCHSISSTRYYKIYNVPICVLSTGNFDGLTDEQKQWLSDHFNCKIRNIDNSIDEYIKLYLVNNEKFRQYRFSLWLRFFTNKIFPEYKGEIHFESDCYVLNDKCIREFILHLKKQGIAARRAFHHGIHSINYDIQDELQNRYFRNYKRAGTGMFLKEYIKEKGLKYIQSGNLYQDYLLYNIPDNPIPTLTHENALCYPNNLNLSYAVHLRSPSGFRNRVDYVSTRKITQPLTQEEYQRHKQISQAQSSRGANLRLIDIPDDYDQRISINFCVYPWEYTIDEEIQKQAEKL